MALGIMLYWVYVCGTYLSLLRLWLRGAITDREKSPPEAGRSVVR